MKILSADQIRAADRFTIAHEPISSIQLMERAAKACAHWITRHVKERCTFLVFCGSGNNGGDGLAISRMLHQADHLVHVFIDATNDSFSEDAEINFLRIKEIPTIQIHDFSEVSQYNFDSNGIVVDALFGTGFNRPLQGKMKTLVEYLNQIPLQKIAVDIPSGLFADRSVTQDSAVFQADVTLTFQCWKRSFLHPETGIYCGRVQVLDIGICKDFIRDVPMPYRVLDQEKIVQIYQPRKRFSHKGMYGKVCLVAGSYGKIGAALMATKAALCTGAGLTFTLAPACGYTILQLSCPEAMFLCGGENVVSRFEVEEDAVVAIGPGLGKDPATVDAFLKFLTESEKPLLLDADALNILAENQNYLNQIPKNSIITPHPKEFERLFGSTKDSFERLELAREKAFELCIFVVLKDHHTQVITPNRDVFYNTTGTSGMAKGGSGDTLTGIILALMAQHYPPEQAALFGVWLHGKAGELAANQYSKEAMLPTDLTGCIGAVFRYLENQKTKSETLNFFPEPKD